MKNNPCKARHNKQAVHIGIVPGNHCSTCRNPNCQERQPQTRHVAAHAQIISKGQVALRFLHPRKQRRQRRKSDKIEHKEEKQLVLDQLFLFNYIGNVGK